MTPRRSYRVGGGAAPYIFVAPFVLLFLVFSVYPIVQSFRLAFYATSGPQDWSPVGLRNFAFLLQDPDFHKAVTNTVTYTIATVLLQLPLSLGLALLLSQKWLKGQNLFRLIFFSPHLLGQVFVGVLFAVLFQPKYGLVNHAYAAITMNPANITTKWLGDPATVMPALVLTSLWMYVGFNMIYFLAALQGVDQELHEAALVDGAGTLARFRAVTLPAIWPVCQFVLVTSTMGSLQLFELPYLLLVNTSGPDNAGLTIVMYLYQNGFASGDLGYASAVGWTLAVGMLVISLAQLRMSGGVGKE
jgi:ABC-type sugar transport system permease subunit